MRNLVERFAGQQEQSDGGVPYAYGVRRSFGCFGTCAASK